MQKVLKNYLSMALFFITGMLFIVSIWFVESKAGLFLWRSAKVFYFFGLALFIIDFLKSKK